MNQRESRYVKVAKIAYHLTKQALPKYSHAKSPHHFELPQVAACVWMMFYLDVSYRDMEEWRLATDKVCQALALPNICGQVSALPFLGDITNCRNRSIVHSLYSNRIHLS